MFSCVTPKMVKLFVINDRCNKRDPCNHYCNITLKDGRTCAKNFYSYEIYALLTKISLKKVTGNAEHFKPNPSFDNYINFAETDAETDAKTEDSDSLECSLGAFFPIFSYDHNKVFNPIPSEILSNVFKDSQR